MKIFLDTNILINEGYVRSQLILALFKVAKFKGLEVIVPEIVMDETVGRFKKGLSKHTKAYVKSISDLNKQINITFPTVDDEEIGSHYHEHLESLFESLQVRVLDYPDVSPKELVEKSYIGEKPFKENGEGHKDYLVWETVKAEIELSECNDAYFLTTNVKDFCKGKDENVKLYSSLAAQLSNKSLIPTIYTNLKSFFDAVISPVMDGVDVKDIPLLSEEDVHSFVAEEVSSTLSYYTAYGIEGLEFSNEITIDGVDNIEVDEVGLKVMNDDEILITVNCNVDIEVSGFVDKHEIHYLAEEGSEVSIIDGNWNDHVMHVGQSIETPVRVELTYSKKDEEISGSNVILEDENFEEYY